MALVALVVVAGLRSVGVVLVSAVIILPAATAHLLAERPSWIAAVSVVLAVGASVLGLFVSYHLDLAAGATIVVLLGVAFFLALALLAPVSPGSGTNALTLDAAFGGSGSRPAAALPSAPDDGRGIRSGR